MKAAFINQHGEAEVLQYGDLPDPVAGPGEVVVDIFAASVNAADWKSRSGGYGLMKFPYVLGRDFSGVVSAVGPAVDDLRIGDEVFAVCKAVRVVRRSPGADLSSTRRPVDRIGIATRAGRFLSAGERRQYPNEIGRLSQHARAADEAEGRGAVAGGEPMEARPRQRCALVRDAADGVELRPAAPAGACAVEPGPTDRALVEDSRSHSATLGFRSRDRTEDRLAAARRR
jgi:hypothetical protein